MGLVGWLNIGEVRIMTEKKADPTREIKLGKENYVQMLILLRTSGN